MTREEHHMLCLGLLAMIYNGLVNGSSRRYAIEQAVESAEQLGLRVSVDRLRAGMPIATDGPAAQ